MTYIEYKQILETAELDIAQDWPEPELEPYGYDDNRTGFLNTPYTDWIRHD